MPTIREIAAEAGLSASTVSIVLSGQSLRRHIPEQTQRRVLDAAQRLGYHPNVSARRLRARGEERLALTIFWASDFRAVWMVRFLRGLQEAVASCGQVFDISIQPYMPGRLCDCRRALSLCNAMIICNASDDDLRMLESLPLAVPVVLYNRHSEVFCTVNVDDDKMGAMAAEIFARHGRRHALILSGETVYSGINTRNESFEREARRLGLTADIVIADNSMRGGFDGCEGVAGRVQRPDCLFCASSPMAAGAQRALVRSGLRIPGDIEMIAIGNGLKETEEFADVPLSVIVLPMENMALACLRQIISLLGDQSQPPTSITLPVWYRPRESCPWQPGDALAGEALFPRE